MSPRIITVKDYLKNKYKKRNSLFSIINGKGFYQIDGEIKTREQVNKMFPTPFPVLALYDIDGRHIK